MFSASVISCFKYQVMVYKLCARRFVLMLSKIWLSKKERKSGWLCLNKSICQIHAVSQGINNYCKCPVFCLLHVCFQEWITFLWDEYNCVKFLQVVIPTRTEYTPTQLWSSQTSMKFIVLLRFIVWFNSFRAQRAFQMMKLIPRVIYSTRGVKIWTWRSA